MNKTILIRKIAERLRENFTVLQQAAQASRAEATHESSKADNKYDTRGLEASYLARGQSRQASEILDAIQLYEALTPQDFTSRDAVALTAAVTLEAAGTRSTYFIGPASGGLEIVYRGEEIMVITPQSPLGQNLMGKKVGHHWSAPLGRSSIQHRILSVR